MKLNQHPNKIKDTGFYYDKKFAYIPTKLTKGEWVWLEYYKVLVMTFVYSDHRKKVEIYKYKINPPDL